MKVAMLLVSVLFLATAVEALPGRGGRQLAKDKKPKKCAADVCWKKCQKLKDDEGPDTPGSMLKALIEVVVPPPQCDIAFMEGCLKASSDVATCVKKCDVGYSACMRGALAPAKVCKKELKTCKKECKKPVETPLDCSFLKGKKKKKCCEKKCMFLPITGCIERCIAT